MIFIFLIFINLNKIFNGLHPLTLLKQSSLSLLHFSGRTEFTKAKSTSAARFTQSLGTAATEKALRQSKLLHFLFLDSFTCVDSNSYPTDVIGFCSYNEPKPEISVFREASFGHGRLNVVDGEKMEWTWHRNDDDQSVTADSVTLKSLVTEPACF